MFDALKRWLGMGGAPAEPECAVLRESLEQRLARLQPFARPGPQLLETQPLVVFDVETSGLNLRRDAVLSVGAVRIEDMGIVLGTTFDRVLRVEADLVPDSQLFHGLTVADLMRGEDPRTVLLDLLEFGQDAVWLAWQAWFDQRMLRGSAERWLGIRPGRLPAVLDLAHAVPMLFPEHAKHGAHLDDWLRRFGLRNTMRHHAVADAMATAELALICLHRARARGLRTWGELAAAMAQSRKASARRRQSLYYGF